MVESESRIYLFLGPGSSSKQQVLSRLKEKILPKRTEAFNQDILYAKELSLKLLQETLLLLPMNQGTRIVVIKNAQELKDDVKKFLAQYVKKPNPGIVLVLDIEKISRRDEFVESLKRYAQVSSFAEEKQLDVFALSRQIELKKTSGSLLILNSLLKNAEKPERILGGLRASWERNHYNPAQAKKRIKLLLKCDIEIKTGKLKPAFALEKLVISLCSLADFSG